MNDTDLAEAYQRLNRAATPPVDAADQVGARVARRRRRRIALGGATAVVVVVAGAGALAAADRGAAPQTAGDPAGPPAPAPVVDPSDLEVTCVDHDMTSASIDGDGTSGVETLTALVQQVAASHAGRYVVDLDGSRVLFLRSDGTVHTAATWFRGGGQWFHDGYFACSDAEETASDPTRLDAAPLNLDVGHCWVAPVEFEGALWDVMAADQFGWGGGQPSDFAGTGEAWRAGDVVSYRDDGGTLLTLVPADGPWVARRGLCD